MKRIVTALFISGIAFVPKVASAMTYPFMFDGSPYQPGIATLSGEIVGHALALACPSPAKSVKSYRQGQSAD